ncbi:MFS transporter [Dermacoccus abyssi]
MAASPSTPSRWALPVILAAQLVIPLSIAGTAVALPGIAGQLGSDPGPLQWVVNGFNAAFAVCTLAWGSVADRAGHDRVFRLGVMIVLIASLASALAPSLLLLDAARVLAGIGAAAVLTGATSVLSLAWEGQARARAFATFGTANGVGLALGPSVCGAVVQAFGWRATFWLPAIVLLAALTASRVVPEARVTIEGRRILDLSLLRNRGYLAMVLVPVAGAVGFVTFLTYLPAAFAAIHNWSAGTSGAMMLIATLPVILAPSSTASLMSRHDVSIGAVVAVSMLCLMAGAAWMLTLAPDRPVALIVPGMLLIGLGFGLPLGIVDGEALTHAPATSSGSAAGLLNFARIGSEALAVAAYSAALTHLVHRTIADAHLANRVAAGGPGNPAAYADALHTVALAAAAIVVLLGLLVWALRRNGRGSATT